MFVYAVILLSKWLGVDAFPEGRPRVATRLPHFAAKGGRPAVRGSGGGGLCFGELLWWCKSSDGGWRLSGLTSGPYHAQTHSRAMIAVGVSAA